MNQMSQMPDTINEDGEVISGLPMIDTAAMVGLAKAEIDMQIATARRFPRSITRAVRAIKDLAILDEETAAECCYALVRRQSGGKRGGQPGGETNKPIEGPSIRLAEIAAQSWGNCRTDARVISVNRVEKYVEAEGVFHDLETNMASRATVRRRISTKNGGIFSDDMIIVTGNAACSIAKRNAILSGIPRGVYRPAYRAAREVIAGDIMTLGENRTKAIKAFASYGVTPDQIFESLDVGGENDITLDHVATLRAMFATIKNGESTVEEMFAKNAPEPPQNGSANLAGKLATGRAAAPVTDGAKGFDADSVIEQVDGKSAGEPEVEEEPTLLDRAREEATDGLDSFNKWMDGLLLEHRQELAPHVGTLIRAARAVDEMAKSDQAKGDA